MRLHRPQALLAHRVDIFRRGAEIGHAFLFGIVEEHIGVRREWRAVEQKKGRAAGERRDEPVPHHPAAGREVEHPVARIDVGVVALFLQVLKECAPRLKSSFVRTDYIDRESP